MSDWEIVEDTPENIKQGYNKFYLSNKNVPKGNNSSSDWEIVEDKKKSNLPKENLGTSAYMAIPRIGGDLLQGGVNFLKNIPNYLKQSKTEIPGLFSTGYNHPLHSLKQGAAGFTQLGHNLLNIPHNIAEYGANRLNLIPKDFPNKVPYQKDISNEINQAFGDEKYPGDKLIRGIGENSLNLLGSGKILSSINPMNLTAKSISKDIINTEKSNKNIYGKLYKNLWDEAKSKGYSDMSHIKPNIDISTIKKYSPKKSIAGIEDFIDNPTIESAHNAKSDLLRIQRDLGKMTTLRTAERSQLKAVNDAIENIKDNMFKDKSGNINNDLLNKYNKIQQGYSSEVIPYQNKKIRAFKRNEISSKELVNALSSGEFMAKRGKHHPELGIRKKVIPGLAAVGTAEIAKLVYDNLKDHNLSNE